MFRARAEGRQQRAVKAKGRETVVDALFRLRRGGLDGLSKFLERGSFVIAQGCEVLVDGPRFR